jgi:protein-tyrosine-phosphatase
MTTGDPELDHMMGISPPKAIAPVEKEHHNYGPAVSALNERRREFVFAVCEGLSGSDAVRRAGYECSSAQAYASRANTLYRNTDVIAALQEQLAKSLRSLGPRAVRAVAEVVEDLNPMARLKAAELILKRVDPEKTLIDAHVVHEIVDHRKDALEQLRSLIALGVAREKLEELYGYSGLPVLERQLAAADAKNNIVTADFTELPEEK